MMALKGSKSLRQHATQFNASFVQFSFERIWHFANAIEQDIDMSYPSEVFDRLREKFSAHKSIVKQTAHAVAEQALNSQSSNRCKQLRAMDEEQLAHQYLVLSTTAYDQACATYSFKPESSQRGRHIHKIAENLALLDRENSRQCLNLRYPFDGIEQCYLFGLKSGINGFCLPCSVKPDLYNSLTGMALDYKTGNSGTSFTRHKKNLQHVPAPVSEVMTSADVTMSGVERKFSSQKPRFRA